MSLPTAHEVRHEGKRAKLGCYAVRYDPYKRVSSHKWQVLGPPDAEGQEEILDDFGTYREAVKDARARSRGEFGDTEGDDVPGRTPEQRAAKHRKAATFYQEGTVGRAYHEAEAERCKAIPNTSKRSKPTMAIIEMTSEHKALGVLQEKLQAAHIQAAYVSSLGVDLDAIGIDVCTLDDFDERATMAYGQWEGPPEDQ